MIDYKELAEAMGDLDEDTVKELLETVMADGELAAAVSDIHQVFASVVFGIANGVSIKNYAL